MSAKALGLGDEAEDAGLIVANLVASDEAIVPTLRSVLERGWGDRFGASLDQFLTTKDNELRKLCNFHFAEFSEGIAEIAQLKEQAGQLRGALEAMDGEIQAKGEAAVKSTESQLRFLRIERHLRQAQTQLRQALNLTRLVQRAQRQVRVKAYFEALQSIELVREVVQGEDIRQLWLERAAAVPGEGGAAAATTTAAAGRERRSQFMARLQLWIPQVIKRIQADVDRALTEWFVQARNQAGQIGSRALDMVAEMHKQAIAGSAGAARQAPEARKRAPSTEELLQTAAAKPTRSRMRSRASSDAVMAWEQRDPSNKVGIAESCLREALSFDAVHQYVDIQTYLGDSERAVAYYKANRLPQASLQTMIPVDIRKLQPGQFAKHFRPLLERLAGFFIIESSLTRSINLVSPYELASLWRGILDEVVPAVRAELRAGVANDPALTLQMVQLLLNLSQLMGRGDPTPSDSAPGAGDSLHSVNVSSNKLLDTSRLMDICASERESVADLLVAAGWLEMRGVLEAESCVPLRLEGASPETDQLREVVARFGLDKLQLDEDGQQGNGAADGEGGEEEEEEEGHSNGNGSHDASTAAFKFSDTVPRLCSAGAEMMDKSFSMARQLGGSLPLRGQPRAALPQGTASSSFVASAASAAQLANSCFERLCDHLERELTDESRDVGMERLCQLSVNLRFLGGAAPSFEAHAKSLANLSAEEEKRQLAQGGSSAAWWCFASLARAQDLAELGYPRIMQSVHEKIEDLMAGGYSVDWAPSEMVEGPHAFVSDTVQFLSVKFGPESALQQLPRARIQAMLFTSCGRISEALVEVLCGPRVKSINALSVYTLSQDIKLLLDFAAGSGIAELRECFTQLDQVVTLLVTADLDGYLDSARKMKSYAYLSPSMVRSVLSKYRQIPGSTRLFASANFQIIKDSDLKRCLKALPAT